MEAALEARGLRKCYTAVPAVSDVTFGLHAGEVLGCLGANGAGKSTIVKMLTGLSEPTRGQVLSFGASIHKDIVGYRRRLGYVPEEPELYSYLSGWEYLEMVGILRGMERAQMVKKIGALLALFSLAPHAFSAWKFAIRERLSARTQLLRCRLACITASPISSMEFSTA